MKDKIRAIRQDADLTQAEFAEKLGVSRSSVLNWEYGQNTPGPAMVEKICRTFNINPLFIGGESDVMHIPPDEDEEIIDRALADADPMLKALLLGIVKKPDGWRLLAESILTAADTLREAGFDLNDKKPGE